MKRFIEGEDRGQSTLFPERLEDWIGEDNPVRVIDVFVDELDLGDLGFVRAAPEATGRPGYHPSVLLKLYIYGYLPHGSVASSLENSGDFGLGATSGTPGVQGSTATGARLGSRLGSGGVPGVFTQVLRVVALGKL